jgi:thiaminase
LEGRDRLQLGLIYPKDQRWEEYENDKWLPRDVWLRSYASKVVDPPQFVHELIDNTAGKWNHDRLHEVIEAISISTRVENDFWV